VITALRWERTRTAMISRSHGAARYGGVWAVVRREELPREGSATMVLLRQLLGDVLRRLRLRQGRTLREVSASARVSLGYLSEVERGQKEASSELLQAICTALGTPLSQVFREVSDNFALAELQTEPMIEMPREPALLLPAEHVPAETSGHTPHEMTDMVPV
jgi:transcriptional regulator with XRE-family HTH domain